MTGKPTEDAVPAAPTHGSTSPGDRWAAAHHVSWTRTATGTVAVLHFAHPVPHVLNEPAATVWELLAGDQDADPDGSTRTETSQNDEEPGTRPRTLDELAEGFLSRTSFIGSAPEADELRAGLLHVLHQLELTGVVRRTADR
ncbi:hypothetical protein EDL96_07955 [Kocuria soli]|uniref:PqqD family protein n=1 Tax=Kocuria soli TaxID=2485125 RepID=A0A3N3ZPS5_9MICC|nr:hypothetical protein [Kocuria soli]ROZ63033.1 hypothetical protein EDL96_07955 [Kocuria soli]